jgi:hypothetical protein
MSNEIIRNDDDSIFQEILKRSATDKEFRQRLVDEPASAIEEVIGVPLATLPRPINVKFIEKEAGLDAVIVLPDFLDPEGVLSDAELEAVAGGLATAQEACNISCICTTCCVTNIL